MAPPTPGRIRGPRPQVNNNIGEAGRVTNIPAPKGVPRDSAGHERLDAFFDRAAAYSDGDDDGGYARSDEEFDAPQIQQRQHSAKKRKSVAQPNGTRGARGERPDRYMLGEDRGRKTGVIKAVARRDEEGFEDPMAFFQSSSPARSVATTVARSTVKKSAANGRRYRDAPMVDDYEEEREGEDESGMIAEDDGTSLSPLTYQRQHASHASHARQPSALRHSMLPSGARSVSRKGLGQTSSPRDREMDDMAARRPRKRLSSLSGDGEREEHEEEVPEQYDYYSGQDEPEQGQDEDDEDEDEDEDEVVRAALTAKSTAALSAGKGKGKARTSTSTATTGNGSPVARRISGANSLGDGSSPTGLMKLDRNGRPVEVSDRNRKGKGKADERSPTPLEETYHHDNEYGGGYDDGEGEAGAESFHFEDDHDTADRNAGDDEEQEHGYGDENVADSSTKPARWKGKGKARQRSSQSPPKKASQRAKKGASSHDRPREVVIDLSRKRSREGSDEAEHGVRRSHREKIPRLEYWRNERIVYKRRASGMGINAIVRVPKEDPEPLSKTDRRKAGGKRGTSARATSRGGTVKHEIPEEQGVDDMTDPDGLVWSWEGDAEVSRRIAFTAKMMNPRPTFDGKFAYQKIYQELDYLAGGILTIPPNGEKALKPSKDNSYIFYCIQGAVSVTVHRTVFSVGPGGTFFVPRGNQYQIQATSNREVRLFFAQGRRVIEYDDGSTRNDTKEDSQRYVHEQQLAEMEEQQEEEEDN